MKRLGTEIAFFLGMTRLIAKALFATIFTAFLASSASAQVTFRGYFPHAEETPAPEIEKHGDNGN